MNCVTRLAAVSSVLARPCVVRHEYQAGAVSEGQRVGKNQDMTDETQPPDVIDDKASDVLAEDEVVHVPPATEELAESLEQGSSYLPDVPHWDEPDGNLPAAR